MDADDIRRKLEEEGIPVDGWKDSAGGVRPAPPTVQRQAAALRKLLEIVQGQVSRDQATAAELREQVARLKHGGGR